MNLKISTLVDNNKVPYILDISKIIKNENYIKQIKDTYNITLITHLRADSKKKIVINTDKEYENSKTQINLLKDRFNS